LLFTCAQTAGTAKGVMKASNAAYRLIASLIQTGILNLLFEIRLATCRSELSNELYHRHRAAMRARRTTAKRA